MNLNEVLDNYNISNATLRNWKKLKYIANLDDISSTEIDDILKNKVGARRNKRISEQFIIPESYINDKKIISTIKSILQLKDDYGASTNEILHETIIHILNKNEREIPSTIVEVLGESSKSPSFKQEFSKIKIKYDEDNDFLGCLYMSLISIGKKDTNGIYYTPYNVVNQIVSSMNFAKVSKIIDPGCGSGNFLIQVYKKLRKNKVSPQNIIENLYGFDIDPIAVLLAKINLYLLDEHIDFNTINVYQKDFLNDDIIENFDSIVGNPPWGKKYTKTEKEQIKKKYDLTFSKLDSFSQFILKSFDILNPTGTLGFVLPSSILNIAVHKDIREFLLKHKINYIKRIGREFEEIVTDVVIISVEKTETENNICEYNNIKILQDKFKENPNYNFLISSDTSLDILKKLKTFPYFHLKNDDISYALGIVTGNNKKYLSDKKSKNKEGIISGKEIDKYNIDYSKIKNFIKFDKNSFQQVASEELYRCKNKIIYKFIGKKLCFAVENRGTLTLNSANIICFKDDVDIFYISAILNSRITQLFFDEMYDTHKLLKNHIQSFYIPDFNEAIKNNISNLSQNTVAQSSYNENIEDTIYQELNLSEKEIDYLKGRYK